MADQHSTPKPPELGASPKPEPMSRERAIELLKTDVKAWNKWRDENPNYKLLDLSRANLGRARLEGADLRGAYLKVADLTEAHLEGADLYNAFLHDSNLPKAHLVGANLRLARLLRAHLEGADLRGAHLEGANLFSAHLRDANLREAHLEEAYLGLAHLEWASLWGADLRGADLTQANLSRASLDSSDLSGAHTFATVFAHLDLSNVRGLESIRHNGPSTVGTDTLVRSRGRIPEVFLRGCGLHPWEVEASKLYDPSLTPEQVNDIQYKIFALRTGPMFLGGIFISYSHEDAKFVDKLYARLMEEGANVWLDRHDMVAGDLEKQVDRAIRLNDVVVLVLSASSVESDWVEHELEKARKKEKDEKRDVLCPVALDDAWKAKIDDVLWRQVKKKNVLDFSKWKTKAFDAPFGKLIKGLRTNFPRPSDDPPASAPKADG